MDKRIAIITIGTSIISNLRREGIEGLEKANEFLKNKDTSEHIYGAEINSLTNLIKKKKLVADKLYLIASDTDEGKKSSELIGKICLEKLNFNEIQIKIIEKLNSDNEYDFAKRGLKNLVIEIADILKKNNLSEMIIAPIGGFKAQIFMTGLVGQIFGITLYYMYEKFNSAIEILPLPISFDNNLFFDNLEFFRILRDKSKMIKLIEIESFIKKEPQLKNLISIEKMDDNNKYVELSPLGNLFYEKLSLDSKNILPISSNEIKKTLKSHVTMKNNEQHLKVSLKDGKFINFLENILKLDYVNKIRLNYFNPDNKGDIIKINKGSESKDGKGNRTIKFEYNHKNGIIGGAVSTTAKDEKEFNAVVIDMNEVILGC